VCHIIVEITFLSLSLTHTHTYTPLSSSLCITLPLCSPLYPSPLTHSLYSPSWSPYPFQSHSKTPPIYPPSTVSSFYPPSLSLPTASNSLSLCPPLCLPLPPSHNIKHSIYTSPLFHFLSPSHTLIVSLYLPPSSLPPSHYLSYLSPTYTICLPPLSLPPS
jgi:hypothetical protein